jgi:hypothetical protein
MHFGGRKLSRLNGNWEDDSVRDSNLNVKVARISFTYKRNKNR